MSLIKVLGLDPSMNNWGYAEADLDLATKKIKIINCGVITTIISKDKSVRRNSQDLIKSESLFASAFNLLEDNPITFVEVPVGSQSSRASVGYGMCCGVLGSLRASGKVFFEVSPVQVKLAGAGDRVASKKAMILWAANKHPEALWPTYVEGNEVKMNESKAEHIADAIAAIYAGLALPEFNQTMQLKFKLGETRYDY